MRRTVALLAALLAAPLALPAAAHPGHHHPAPPPTLGATNLIVSYGSNTVDVVIPKAAELVETAPTATAAPGWATFTTTGPWAAVALISRGSRSAGRPVNAVQVHTASPDHCPAAVPPDDTAPQCRAVVEHTFVNSAKAARRVGGTNRWALPAGRYQLVVGGPAHTLVVLTFRLAGLRGNAGVVAYTPATTSFKRDRVDNLALAHANGAFSRSLSARGFGVLGLWYTTAGDEPGELTYAECLTKGTPAPANPDDCTPVAAAKTAADVPDAVAKQPVFYAASYGGFTLTNAGNGTFETPPLAAGTYTNTYRVSRGGRGPAVGTFAWWVQADAYK